jgi:hypothetical protein
MAAFVIALAFWGSAGMVRAQYLPRHAPLPEAAPRPAAAPEGPEADANTLSAEAGEEPETPPTAPIPAKRPEPPRQMAGLPTPPPPADEHEPGPGSGETAPVAGPPVPPEIAPVPPSKPPLIRKVILRPTPPPAPARLACRADLRRLGVKFEERAPLSDPAAGCSVPNPIEVSALSSSVGIGPGAVMNCALADQLARFVRDTASPSAERIFDSPIASIRQASAYVCRDRHGTERISEHAFGNAIDIAEFVLKDGTTIDVKDYGDSDPKRTEFLDEVRQAACGPFRTVLGPGADADHSLHFHFDLEPRKSKNAFCQ